MGSILTRYPLLLAGALLLALSGPLCLAQQPTAEQPPAAAQPPVAPPLQNAPPPAPPPSRPVPLRPLDPRVQQVLAQAREAYKALKTYQDLGSITTTITVGGRPAEASMPASTTFGQPGKFISNYEAMSLYSDGQTLWIYTPVRGKYYQQPLSQQPPPGASVPTPQSIMRNLPVLTMLANPDQSLLATATAFESTYRGQEQLATHSVDHITLVSPADTWFGATDEPQSGENRITLDVFFDAKTHMLLRLNINMTGAMRNRITKMDQQRGQGAAQPGPPGSSTPARFASTRRSPTRPLPSSLRPMPSRSMPSPPCSQPPAAPPRSTTRNRPSASGSGGGPPALCGAGLRPARPGRPAGQTQRPARQGRRDGLLGDLVRPVSPVSAAHPEVARRPQGPGRGRARHSTSAKSRRRSWDSWKRTGCPSGFCWMSRTRSGRSTRSAAIPHTVVVDQKGQVVKVHTGFVPGQEKVAARRGSQPCWRGLRRSRPQDGLQGPLRLNQPPGPHLWPLGLPRRSPRPTWIEQGMVAGIAGAAHTPADPNDRRRQLPGARPACRPALPSNSVPASASWRRILAVSIVDLRFRSNALANSLAARRDTRAEHDRQGWI